MNPPPRRVLTTPSWASNKRKERDTTSHKPTVHSAQAVRKPPEPAFDFLKPSNAKPSSSAHPIRRPPKPKGDRPGSAQSSGTGPSNMLLAGYLAHEFLTRGSLMGEKWDPARAQAVPLESHHNHHHRRAAKQQQQKGKAGRELEEGKQQEQQRYREVANLMKTEGATIQGIVNPTELGRFLNL